MSRTELRKNLRLHYVLLTGLLMFSASSLLCGLELRELQVAGLGTQVLTHEGSSIQQIRGKGFQIAAHWQLSKYWFLMLSSGHQYHEVKQIDAIKNWDWPYWLKIYGYVVYLAENDPVYNVEVQPHQTLKVKPVLVSVGRRFVMKRRLQFEFSVGGGISWYERRLYLEETWQKYFESIDYTYLYDFRNHADPRTGWVTVLSGKTVISFRLSNDLTVSGFAQLDKYFKFRKDSKYFPVNIAIQYGLAINFLY